MTAQALTDFADKVDLYMRAIISEHLHGPDNELLKGKITMPQFITMDYLLRGCDSNMTSLSKYMHVTTAAMTGMVDRLVRDKIIERLQDPSDRRVVRVRLTSDGIKLVKKINDQRRGMIMRIFGKLSDKDRSNYLGILARINHAINKEHETNKK